jgi:hypothetical protein
MDRGQGQKGSRLQRWGSTGTAIWGPISLSDGGLNASDDLISPNKQRGLPAEGRKAEVGEYLE